MKQRVSWTFAGDISVYLAVKIEEIYWEPSTVRTPPLSLLLAFIHKPRQTLNQKHGSRNYFKTHERHQKSFPKYYVSVDSSTVRRNIISALYYCKWSGKFYDFVWKRKLHFWAISKSAVQRLRKQCILVYFCYKMLKYSHIQGSNPRAVALELLFCHTL